MPLPEYLDTWVNADNWVNAKEPKQSNRHSNGAYLSINQFQGFGNSLNNLQDVYPDHNFVEFYYPGTDEYGGMDWYSLRLVFDDYQGKPYLVAIINDQWTI